ncbi:hypothetical protein K7H91_08820 [Martelella mediterranea]|uniref:hypothetical protein n=1 Tax=Martelella mediterranea TaxID=293089 RepID=UPI003AF35296|nr:hypothetical protein [Martelella mediterranea]
MRARSFPATAPEPVYDPGKIVRRVSSTKTYVAFNGKAWRVPKAFQGEALAIRPLETDGQYRMFFAANQVALIDLRNGK